MIMITETEYLFADEPSAYRFLNSVKNWHQFGMKVEFGRDSSSVRITYKPASLGFDDTLSRLDKLAEDLGGKADS